MQKLKNKKCPCGNTFKLFNSTQKYCSYKCTKHYTAPDKKSCTKCKKTRLIKFFEKPTTRHCKDCKRRSKRTKKLNSVSYLRKIAWKTFSTYIRTRDSLKTTKTKDYCRCVTCNEIVPYKKIQAGHFIGGRGNSVLFDEKIVNGQCYVCNIMKSGNYDSYNLYMLNKYGGDRVIEMLRKKKDIVKYTTADYKDIIELYKNRLNSLIT